MVFHTLAVGPGQGEGLCCCCPCTTAGVWSCPSRWSLSSR